MFLPISVRTPQADWEHTVAYVYRGRPWVRLGDQLYLIERWEETVPGEGAQRWTPRVVHSGTFSEDLLLYHTYAHMAFFQSQAHLPARDRMEDEFWLDNFFSWIGGRVGFLGRGHPLLITPQLLRVQRWILRCITARRAKRARQRLAVAMGLHARLGASSALRSLDSGVAGLICAVLT
jgi:hypothetical protein